MKTLKKLATVVSFLVLVAVVLTGTVFAVDGEDNVLTTPADYGNGTVQGGTVRLRVAPTFGGDVIGVLNSGSRVQVNGACGDWYEVVVNDRIGYIYGEYVLRDGASRVYTVQYAPVEENPVSVVEPVTTVSTAATQETYYIDPDYVAGAPIRGTDTALPAPAAPAPAAPPAAPPPPAAEPPAVSYGVSGQQIVNTAMQYIGVPYVWAGTSPETGFDCSGLVYYVYGQHGIKLNRVAQAMYYNGTAADLGYLQVGDILLFGSSTNNIWHAAIYVGNGSFIHAPYSGASVRVDTLASATGLRLVAARRLA